MASGSSEEYGKYGTLSSHLMIVNIKSGLEVAILNILPQVFPLHWMFPQNRTVRVFSKQCFFLESVSLVRKGSDFSAQLSTTNPKALQLGTQKREYQSEPEMGGHSNRVWSLFIKARSECALVVSVWDPGEHSVHRAVFIFKWAYSQASL